MNELGIYELGTLLPAFGTVGICTLLYDPGTVGIGTSLEKFKCSVLEIPESRQYKVVLNNGEMNEL